MATLQEDLAGYANRGREIESLSLADREKIADAVIDHEFMEVADFTGIGANEMHDLMTECGYAMCSSCADWFSQILLNEETGQCEECDTADDIRTPATAPDEGEQE